jgi:3-dehydrotetronate 4-kinase
MLLGCIADDFTGATDLANTLTRQGMRTVQTIGISDEPPAGADAVVVALKTRTIAPLKAVEESLAACRWLRQRGAEQIFFKYCSTFDSTDKGNIGPVADALLKELNADITTICPAFPENARTIYLGHLFVGNTLLSDSTMRHHPLTPMTDSNLVRVMSRQTVHGVDNISHATVRRGGKAVHDRLAELARDGKRYAVVDALTDDDLLSLGEACADLVLVTGGSGAALGLPANFQKSGKLKPRQHAKNLPRLGGDAVVLAGSCSAATLNQINIFKAEYPARAMNVAALMNDAASEIDKVVAWVGAQSQPCLVYTSAAPEAVAELQTMFGQEQTGDAIETALGVIAARLAANGMRRFVVAGGETSGAVTKALGVNALDIGPQVAPGVPATQSRGATRFGLVLKSGNFGGPDFFREAIEAIP